MKKLLVILVTILGLTSCGVNGSGTLNSNNSNNSNNNGNTASNSSNSACGGTIDLEAINDYLENDPYWKNMNDYGNKMTLIPFTHINGPKIEWNFFAFVNFEFDATYFYKYQVTYLSCTCRDPDVNYWQTAYVELSIPGSGKIEDVKLRTLSFEKDGDNGHYIAGFWGDSGTNGNKITGSDVTYEDIRDGFIPFLVGKSYAQLSSYDGYTDKKTGKTYDDTVFGIDPEQFEKDMAGVPFHDKEQVTLDDFGGASVSTNNILRMLLSLMEYHAANNI